MNKITTFIKNEFKELKPFDWCFLAFGLVLQVIAIVYSAKSGDPNLGITAVSGITGIIAVVLCAQGKLISYIFNYTQLLTYMFGVVIPLALWGEAIENIFYFVTMFWGMIHWAKAYNNDAGHIKAKMLNVKGWVIWIGIFIVCTVAFAFFLTNAHIIAPAIFPVADPQPILDSITTIAPFIGQILLCAGYADQWIFWIVEDIVSVIMFIALGNAIMTAQYVFWTLNCVYGYIKWRKMAIQN